MKSKTKFYLSIILILFTIKLSVVSSAGVVNFKATDLDSPPLDLVWCGNQRETVLVLTELNSLYRSDDKGFSFKKLNDVLIHTGKQELEESENEIGKISRIIESPVDKSLLILLGTHGINWIGEDCGRKVRALNHGRKIQEYMFHPTERNWGLASAFTLCEDFSNGEPCKIYKELFVTKDLGENWEILGSYIVQFGWGIVGNEHIQAGIPKERILVTLEPRGKGHQSQRGWSYKVDFVYSDDFFKTKRIGAHKGNKFLLTKNYLFVAQVTDQDLQEVMLLACNSQEKLYNLLPIETTSKIFREHSYTFLETSDISVLNINHFGESSKYGHIYTSGPRGMRYSLSLRYNVRGGDHKCDFQKIESIEGTYVANVISQKFMKNYEQELEEEAFGESISMEEKKHKRDKTNGSYKDFIKTVVSYNKGGNWRRLKAPQRDMEGKKYDCENYCYLNLHGVTGEYPTYYSVQSAAGLIIGNGNVGRFLSTNSDEVSTYLSRDGGITWFEVKKGSHIYEIGDHGALIVIADDQSPTNRIYYSWDEGMTWQDLQISNEKMMIKNIIIEPMSISQNFVVYGELNKKGEKKGVVVGLDFSDLHKPQCRNPDQPNSEGSDYETWTPNDGRAGHECLLGKKVVYIRRKREAECFNGMTFERKNVVELCECTDDDYECDVGFARSDVGEPCVAMNSGVKDHNHPDSYTPPTECNGTFSISKGYRKVPGSSCVNGVKYDPIVISCPNKFFALLGKSVFALIIGFIFIVVFITLLNGNYFSKFLGMFNSDANVRKPEYVVIDGNDGDTLFDNDDENLKLDVNDSGLKKKNSKKQSEMKDRRDDEFALNSVDDKDDLINLDSSISGRK